MSIEVKPSSERKCTNVPALVIAIVFLVLTVILVTYCGIVGVVSPKTSDINSTRSILTLKDGCGNICGQLNINISSECGNPDKRNATKLFAEKDEIFNEEINQEYKNTTEVTDTLLTNQTKLAQCVEECPEEYVDISNICILNSTVIDLEKTFQEMMDSLKSTWYYILIICFVAFVFSYIFLILFRYAAKEVIWIINIGFVVLVVVFCIFLAARRQYELMMLFLFVAFIMSAFLYIFRTRIDLVAKLFEETSKALIDVPAIMFEPVLTIIALFISFIIYITFYTIISFAGEDEPLADSAHICNFISFTFITQFIIGCQNFIIAGAICRWYFTRDKTKLEKPIRKSFSYLFKFHLGSVCFSAILVTLIKLLKSCLDFIKNVASQSQNKTVVIIAACFICIVEVLQKLMIYLIRNAYIIIAKEGTPFLESGKRAFRLLSENIKDVVVLNQIGDIVLFVCRLFITLAAGLVGYIVLSKREDDFPVFTFIISIILAFLIAHSFVMVFEMTVDTIFISFCIDFEENNGQTKPYYMSEGLKKVIQEIKEINGGTMLFGPRDGSGLPDGSGIPMMPMQQKQPMYPNVSGPQQPYPQQPYPQMPMLPPQSYPQSPYPNNLTYPQKN